MSFQNLSFSQKFSSPKIFVLLLFFLYISVAEVSISYKLSIFQNYLSSRSIYLLGVLIVHKLPIFHKLLILQEYQSCQGFILPPGSILSPRSISVLPISYKDIYLPQHLFFFQDLSQYFSSSSRFISTLLIFPRIYLSSNIYFSSLIYPNITHLHKQLSLSKDLSQYYLSFRITQFSQELFSSWDISHSNNLFPYSQDLS